MFGATEECSVAWPWGLRTVAREEIRAKSWKDLEGQVQGKEQRAELDPESL